MERMFGSAPQERPMIEARPGSPADAIAGLDRLLDSAEGTWAA
mgnify:CR=1 FL=1